VVRNPSKLLLLTLLISLLALLLAAYGALAHHGGRIRAGYRHLPQHQTRHETLCSRWHGPDDASNPSDAANCFALGGAA
jgi:hypothetical protein